MASICCSPPDSVPPVLTPALLQDGEQAEDAVEIVVQFAFSTVGAHFQVFHHAEAGEDPPAFGDVPYAQSYHLMGRQVADLHLVEANGAARRVDQARDGPQGGGFARPVGPEQRHDLAFLDVYVDLTQGRDGAVADADVGQLQQGHLGLLAAGKQRCAAVSVSCAVGARRCSVARPVCGGERSPGRPR